MDGRKLEDAEIVTHFESDYGAAPRVLFRIGEEVTVVDPDFRGREWIGFRGKVTNTPFLSVCRTQAEIKIEGDWKLLLERMKGFHWILVYGDYLKEVGYALGKMGIKWVNITDVR